ncbi:MAG: exodeoxyribonuclease VII large subunit, partial [Pseudomonadota bacterium]
MKYTEPSQSDSRTILSVTDINLQLKQSIAANFSLLWIEGEISNLARPASGHIYFSLKDENAQIRCVMFRINNQRVPFEISNGTQVIVRAKASLYEPRGDLQLIIDNMEEAGYGALQRQFE